MSSHDETQPTDDPQPTERDAPVPEPTDHDDDGLGEKGRDALRAERQRRKDAEKRARDLESAEQQREAERKKQRDKEAAEQGKWKELADQRDADLQQATTNLESVTSERDALMALAETRLDSLVKDLPKEIADLAPDDDAPITKRLAWAEKAAAAAARQEIARGNGPNPKGAPGGKSYDELMREARASGRYQI